MSKIIDLTMPIYEGMPNHPIHGRTPLILPGTRNHQTWKMFQVENPYDPTDVNSFQNEQIMICSHTGTHMDACLHADPEGCSIEHTSLQYGYGDAVWLDVSHKFGPRAEITAKDLRDAEAASGTHIQKGDIVLIHTGWSLVGDLNRYVDEHMGITKDAGEWLREKGIKTLGIDNVNPDTKSNALTKSLPVHVNFLKPRSIGLPQEDYIAIIENVVNIHKISKSRFTFIGAPLPIRDGTGSPIRAFAVVDE